MLTILGVLLLGISFVGLSYYQTVTSSQNHYQELSLPEQEELGTALRTLQQFVSLSESQSFSLGENIKPFFMIRTDNPPSFWQFLWEFKLQLVLVLTFGIPSKDKSHGDNFCGCKGGH